MFTALVIVAGLLLALPVAFVMFRANPHAHKHTASHEDANTEQESPASKPSVVKKPRAKAGAVRTSRRNAS